MTEANRLESDLGMGPEAPADPPAAEFASILFPDGEPTAPAGPPACFRDLNLDQVVAAIVGGRDEHHLEAYFHMPLRSIDAVTYRQEVFRDLEDQPLRAAIRGFGEGMRKVRAYRALADTQRYRLEQQRWLLDAALIYCEAASALRDSLARATPRSRGLRSACAYLSSYLDSVPLSVLADEAKSVASGLEGVRYTVRINGGRVTIAPYEGEHDYTILVERTFARFRAGRGDSHLVSIPDPGSMSHVDAEIAERVASLFPEEFRALDAFCARHADFLDPVVARFDREVRFYVAYLEHLEGLGSLPVSYPSIVHDWGETAVDGGWDMALARAVASRASAPLVRNGFALTGPERVLVVTGPNQGGKTTFARMVGQVHYLAALGAPVPAVRATLVLVDGVFTAFGHREDLTTLRGRLDDELVRLRAILERATDRSLILLNEVFASTSVADAVFLGREVLGRIASRGCGAVWVTFVDELATFGEATVSMVAGVDPDDPARRTFAIARQPADGRAYAWAVANRYGLSYDVLRRRVAG